MNKQNLDGIQKWKKGYLVRKSKIAMYLYHPQAEPETMSLLFKEQRKKKKKKIKNRFLGLYISFDDVSSSKHF